MTEPLANPHDRFFKDLFSRSEAAQDFLRYYLPAELVNLLDLSSLEVGKDSFIDPDLQTHFSDLLYKVRLHTGEETHVYVLFEHKSYPDPLIALQVLRYMVRIWEQGLKQNQPLLPVIPLVVYHGLTRWRVSLNFTDLFNLPQAMKPYVPEYAYWLCDLSRYSDEEIRGVVTLRVGLLLLKYILREDLGAHLREILALLQDLSRQRTGLDYLQTILRYLAGSTDKISPDELRQAVTQVFAEGEDLMPTIAEQWIEQGLMEGLARGREEGREEGREAALIVLRRTLSNRFEVPLDYFDEILQSLDLAEITQLSEAAFETDSLADFEQIATTMKETAEE